MNKTEIIIPWTKKYIPKSLEEMVLPREVRNNLETWIGYKSLPDLILLGAPGTGKTTLCQVLINELKVEHLFINALEEAQEEFLIEKLKTFMLKGNGQNLRIVFISHANYLDAHTQEILNDVIEVYPSNTRFVLTGNYDWFIPPVKDRCMVLNLDDLDRNDLYEFACRILHGEGVSYNDGDIFKIIKNFAPSVRSILKVLQYCVVFESERKLLKLGQLGSRKHDIEPIFESFKKFGAKEARRTIRMLGFNDWETGYRYFIENAKDDIERLIAFDYLFKNYVVVDKELNFFIMMLALENRILPANYFPEAFLAKGVTKKPQPLGIGIKRKDGEMDELDIHKVLSKLKNL
ncbi:MAG TPA: AAA family ATPase [Thermodesulfobacteriota bacterium]|nr:AAA family ATPase [Thermodesulfobacteriota bacterium]